MGLMPWEKTTTCPYNPSHQITVSRIQKHLVRILVKVLMVYTKVNN